MLLEREIPAAEFDGGELCFDSAGPSRGAPAAPTVPHAPAARYGERRGLSPTAIGVTVFVHVLVALALAGLGTKVLEKPRERLAVVELSLTPPPSPPPAEPEPPSAQLVTAVEPPPLPIPVVPPRPVQVALALAPMVAVPVPTPPVSVLAAPAAPAAPPAPPAPPSVVTSSDLATRMISGDPPRYPIESRRRKEQGVVELSVVVGIDGRVEMISVSKSSGHSRLDDVALRAVRNWRWEPTLRDGVATKVRGIVEIPFVLQPAG